MKKNSQKKPESNLKSRTLLLALRKPLDHFEEGQIAEYIRDFKYLDFHLVAFHDFDTALPCGELVRATYYVRKDLLEPIGYL